MIFIYPITIQKSMRGQYFKLLTNCDYRVNNVSYLGMNLRLNVDIKYLIALILYISESS